MTNSLPSNPSLENLKKQAKALQEAWKAGDAEALARVRAAHPRYANRSDEQLREAKPRLTDCQLVLAREAGFDSWPQLRVEVESAKRKLADQFIDLACLCYDDPHFDHRSFHTRAYELLRNNPGLAEANIWAAATAGNAAAVEKFLNDDPGLVSRPGGPHGWAPLVCACYSRVKPISPSHSTFEVARLLLDRGADPNAYTMKHNDPPGSDQARRFAALTGLFGSGSTGPANQPPHPRWRELAELLLERGADPADEEALHMNAPACLELLLRYGLKPDAPARRPIGDNPANATLLGRSLARAAIEGDVRRVKLLLTHGARTSETFDSKTPWQYAMDHGHLEIARALEEAGAPTSDLSDVERFASLCLAGDETGARAMLARNPNLLAEAPKDLVFKAANAGRKEAINLVLDLGFDPDWQDDCAALHSAAGRGAEAVVRLLLERGASLTLRDPWYDSTAVGWADFFDHTRLRDMLLSEGSICLFDALDYDRLDRVADVLSRDPEALNRPFAECLSHEPKPEDWQTPLVRMVDRGKTEAVCVLLDHDADITARHPDGRTLLQLARDNALPEITGLLQERGATRNPRQ
jgi:ankyrin repeat protein